MDPAPGLSWWMTSSEATCRPCRGQNVRVAVDPFWHAQIISGKLYHKE